MEPDDRIKLLVWGAMALLPLLVVPYFIYTQCRIEVPARHMAILIKKVGKDLPNGEEIAPSGTSSTDYGGGSPGGHPSSMPLLLDRAGLAALLGVSISTVTRLNNKGALVRPLRLGKSLRWHHDTILQWLAAGAPPRREWERMNSSTRQGRGSRKGQGSHTARG